MKYRRNFANGCIVAGLGVSLFSCGGTGAGNPSILLQSAPLAGPNAASMEYDPFDALERIFGIQSAFAAVSSFVELKACNDTMIFIDTGGNQVNVNGTSNPSIGQGLLDFSPTSTQPMPIGDLNIAPGTVLSEIDITFAVVPSVCQGVNYALEFNDGPDGVRDITQNTAFKFLFPAGGAPISGNPQTLTLMFGSIVNGMVSLGTSLDNSTIQTVNVGQAR